MFFLSYSIPAKSSKDQPGFRPARLITSQHNAVQSSSFQSILLHSSPTVPILFQTRTVQSRMFITAPDEACCFQPHSFSRPPVPFTFTASNSRL
ncbi:hypothetical protein E2C01_067483 [Portunus trituberculatus]|uniref:Uncharacterized protein n=1 Tax=Portunus trituberculatus TaxID=210409 RepID=A0A5B7HTR2_PORTR|nr:hypothetical protein [Portunus trituberculatus]